MVVLVAVPLLVGSPAGAASARIIRSEAEAEKAYAFSEGRIMAPSELSVGSHTLAYTATFPAGSEGSQITFSIDAAGTGACL